MTEAIAVNVVCIAVVAANGLYVTYRWTPRLLSPYLQLACAGALLFCAGNFTANLTTGSETFYALSLVVLYTGLFLAVCGWWLVTVLVARHQGATLFMPRVLWHHLPIALLAAVWLSSITNPWHGQFITPVPGERSLYGPAWYAGALVCWLLITTTVVFCISRAVRATYGDDRWQMMLCATAMGAPALLNLTYTMGSSPPTYDPTIIGFALSTSLFVIAVYRGQIYGATGVRLEDAIENDSRPGILLDRNQRMVHANEAAQNMFNIPEIRTPATPFLAERLTDRNGEPVSPDQLLDGDMLFRLERDPDVWLSVEHRPIKLQGVDVGAAWFLRNESGRVRLDEAMQAARKFESLGLIAGGIAHDFNNLLVSVLGNAELAQLKLGSENSEAKELLQRIVRAGEQGAGLARQLLTYAGKAGVELTQVDLNQAVRELNTMLRSSMRSEVAIDLSLAEHSPTLLADSSQVTQMLLNLIVNAEEALPVSGGKITIKTGATNLTHDNLAEILFGNTASAGPFVWFSVADDGPGVDDDTLRRMFDPFFSTKSVGRGLGLAAALGTVRAHSGALHVKSEPGSGTEISIYLPAESAQRSATGDDDPALSSRPSWEGTALVVEDDDAVRHVHRLMLEDLGFRVIEADSGDQALCVEGPINIAVIDQTMPGMSGDVLARSLADRSPDLPMLLVSGYSEDWVGDRPRNCDFLPKPFNRANLAEKISGLLRPTGS